MRISVWATNSREEYNSQFYWRDQVQTDNRPPVAPPTEAQLPVASFPYLTTAGPVAQEAVQPQDSVSNADQPQIRGLDGYVDDFVVRQPAPPPGLPPAHLSFMKKTFMLNR